MRGPGAVSSPYVREVLDVEPAEAQAVLGLVVMLARVFLQSHEGIGVGTFKKVECLGSGADAEAAASVPDVCSDCVRGKYE